MTQALPLKNPGREAHGPSCEVDCHLPGGGRAIIEENGRLIEHSSKNEEGPSMGHNHVVKWWHAYAFDNRLRRLFHKPEKLLAPWVEPQMTVLDVGCGMGFFSIGMAKMMNDGGRVIAVDLQDEMLGVLAKRAGRAGVGERIRTHQCAERSLGVTDTVDFALAFWVVHEAPDARELATQIRACLKPGAKLLVAEPKLHVSEPQFDEMVDAVCEAGLEEYDRPRVSLSHAVLFRNA